MAVFTSNQVNHVYVVKAVKDTIANVTDIGDVAVGKTADNEFYFVYKNADGGNVRSDLIPIKNIMWAKGIAGDHRTQKRALKKYTVTVPSLFDDPDEVAKVVGDTLTVTLEEVLQNGIETVYRKQASVLIKKDYDSTTIADRLFKTLEASFKRDDYVNDKFELSIASNVITIAEVSQSAKYKAGLYANDGIQFTVFSEDENLTVEEDTTNPTYISNSYSIADLEYFALGERGDKYRLIGWPNAFPSKTLAEVGDDVEYDVLQIHFAFTDSNEGVQKSEKDITFASAEDSVISDLVEKLGSNLSLASSENKVYDIQANSEVDLG